jgi:SAM-dependent methyltransferase
MSTTCPLCAKSSTLVDEIETHAIVNTWSQEFGIDVEQYFCTDRLSLYQCEACSLGFFLPPSPGGREMYEQLQRFDWYYEEEKWEFVAASKMLDDSAEVLDVGCGAGRFLDLLAERSFTRLSGLETNAEGADAARKKGFRIYTDPNSVPGSFDAVCAFQILEHVEDPVGFLKYMCSRLRPGGDLIIAVPNNDGFTGKDVRLPLNMPPHHVSRWGRTSLRCIPQVAPVRFVCLMEEPLPEKHVDWWLTTKVQFSSMPKFAERLTWRVAIPILRGLLGSKHIRSRIHGHTVLARFATVE